MTLRTRLSLSRTRSNSALLTGSALLSRAGGIIVIPAVARTVGPGNLGAYQIANVLAGYGLLIALFGLSPLVVRAMVEERDSQPDRYWSLLVSRACSTLVAAAVVGIVAVGIGYGRTVYVLLAILCAGMVANVAVDCANIVFQSNRRLTYALTGAVMAVVVYVGGALPALAAGLGVAGVAAANAGSSALQAAYSIVTVRRRFFKLPRPRPAVNPLRELREALPFFSVASTSSLINRADIVILSLFVPFGTVGVYAAGYLALDVCLLIPNALGQAIYPELAEAATGTPADLQVKIRRYLRHSATVLAALTAAVWVAAPVAVDWLFGAGFEQSTDVLRITMPSLVLAAVTTTLGRAIFASHGQRDVVLASGTAAAFNVAGNLALDPFFGILGAAWITTATYAMTAAMHWYFARRRGYGPALGDVAIPIASGVVAIGLVIWVAVGDVALIGAVLAGLLTLGFGMGLFSLVRSKGMRGMSL